MTTHDRPETAVESFPIRHAGTLPDAIAQQIMTALHDDTQLIDLSDHDPHHGLIHMTIHKKDSP